MSGRGFPARIHPDPLSFLEAAGGTLQEKEVLNSLPAGILLRLAGEPGCYGSEPFLCTVSDPAGRLVAAAVQTPPHNLILCDGLEWPQEAFDSVTDAALAAGYEFPGSIGPASISRAFACRYSDRFGAEALSVMELGLYELRDVLIDSTSPGFLRRAGRENLDLVLEWAGGFHFDCFGREPSPEYGASVEKWVTAGDVFLWIDGGRPVSMSVRNRPTWHGMTVSGVYTPPALRRHGYATSCVAQLSRLLLESGWAFCALFTDLSNPTSNHVYTKIGFRQVGTFLETRFQR